MALSPDSDALRIQYLGNQQYAVLYKDGQVTTIGGGPFGLAERGVILRDQARILDLDRKIKDVVWPLPDLSDSTINRIGAVGQLAGSIPEGATLVLIPHAIDNGYSAVLTLVNGEQHQTLTSFVVQNGAVEFAGVDPLTGRIIGEIANGGVELGGATLGTALTSKIPALSGMEASLAGKLHNAPLTILDPTLQVDPSALARNVGQQLQDLADDAIRTLDNDPSRIQAFSDPRRLQNLMSTDPVARNKEFGNAFERMLANRVRQTPLNDLLSHTGQTRGPNGRFISSLDFTPRDPAALANTLYDLTTTAKVAAKTIKYQRKNQTVIIITYDVPPVRIPGTGPQP